MSSTSFITRFRQLPLKFLAPATVIAFALLLAGTMLLVVPGVETQPAAKRLPVVKIITASPQDMTLKVESEGVVQPSIEIDLSPQVSGRISWISSSLVNGGNFNKDDVLLRVESRDYQYQLEQASAEKQRAEVELEIARKDYQRQKDLHRQRLVSESELDDAFKLLRLAEAADKSANAASAQAALQLERAEIRAPFTGRVHSESVDVGQFIKAGRSIATLYSDQKVEIRLPIANADIGYLDWPTNFAARWPEDLSTPVTISSQYGGQTFHWDGKLIRLESEIDATTRLFYAVAEVENQTEAQQPPLAKGLFVRAHISGRNYQDIIAVPRAALRGENRVLVLDDDNRLHYRDVTVLRIQGEDVLISAGISAGEIVCVSPLNVVVEGMSVQPVPARVRENTAS